MSRASFHRPGEPERREEAFDAQAGRCRERRRHPGASGSSLDRIVKATVYITDVAIGRDQRDLRRIPRRTSPGAHGRAGAALHYAIS